MCEAAYWILIYNIYVFLALDGKDQFDLSSGNWVVWTYAVEYIYFKGGTMESVALRCGDCVF